MKNEVELIMKTHFEKRHWCLKSVFGLLPAFLRDIAVTPCFTPRIVKRPYDVCLIDGYIGLLHRRFESDWVKEKRKVNIPINTKSLNNYLPIELNIANFRELTGATYVDKSQMDSEVRDIVVTLVDLLERMPHDEASLRSAFQKGMLLGMPIDMFQPFGREEKFFEFKEFILAVDK